MNILHASAVLAATFMAATPAQAAIIVNSSDVGAVYDVAFTTPNNSYLTSALSLTFLGAGASSNSYKFGFTLANTSSAYTSKLISLAFNVDPNVTSVSENSNFSRIVRNATFWTAGQRDVCLQYSGNSCVQHSGGFGTSGLGEGTFTLNFATALDSISLDDFVTKYIEVVNVAPNTQGGKKKHKPTKPEPYAAIGYGTYTPPVGGVPEPATWAMLLLGFFMVGGAMRYRRTDVRRVSYS